MTIIKKEDLTGRSAETSQQHEEESNSSVFDRFQEKTYEDLSQDMDTYFGDVLSKETESSDDVEGDEDISEGDNSDNESFDGGKPSKNNQQSKNDANSEESEEAENSDDESSEDETNSRKDKKPSRSTKRIKQLLDEKKQALSKVEEAEFKRLEAERERDILRKKLAESHVASVDTQIKAIKNQMVQAQDEGDTEKSVELMAQLSELQGNKKAFEAVKESYKDLDETKPVEKPRTQTSSSETRQELMQEWIENTPWFVTQQRIYEDDDFVPTQAHVQATQVAVQMEKTLIQEGYDPETEEFYETLTKRMVKLMKMYGVDKELLGNVQSKVNTTGVSSDNVSENNITKTEDDGEDTKVTSKSRPKVSGSTRITTTPKTTQRIDTIPKQLREIAVGLGFDPVEYAKGNMVPLK